jgi:MFS family permease
MREYLELLQHRQGMRNLWVASVISLIGDWFNTIATLMIINRFTNSDLAVSWLLIAKTLPFLFMGPVAGVVVDRFNRKHVMIASDILRAGIVLCFLLIDRPERLWLIYLLTTLQIVISAFFQPASQAIIPQLVSGPHEISLANILQSVTWSATLTIGSALGGWFANLFGADASLVFDSATFIISALLVWQILYKMQKQEKLEKSTGWADFIEGARYILNKKDVAVLTLVKTIGQIGNGDIIIVVFGQQLFSLGRQSAASLGILYTAAGAGAVLGPLISNRFVDDSFRSLRWGVLAGYILIPLGWFVMSLANNLWLASLGILIRLAGGSLNWTYSNILIQIRVPERLQGRVFALDLGLFTLANGISLWLSGYLLDAFKVDPRQLVAWFAAVGVLPLLFWILVIQLQQKGKMVEKSGA